MMLKTILNDDRPDANRSQIDTFRNWSVSQDNVTLTRVV